MATTVIAGRETLHFRDEYGFWGDYDGHSSVKGKKESEGFAVLVMFINGSGGGKPSVKMVLEEESNFKRRRRWVFPTAFVCRSPLCLNAATSWRRRWKDSFAGAGPRVRAPASSERW
nr:hypothetical protein Iba_scaffold21619CG0010 [Ipomoea batatas]